MCLGDGDTRCRLLFFVGVSVLGTVGVGGCVCGYECVWVIEILGVDRCFLWVSLCLPAFVGCMFVVFC